ncbi:membrane protein [Bacillus manliponensis]|uniref:Membrane protein n=1 Tax=Bacillus manliponensis TaxID=574376 RepID=A0A073K1W9_9BACI|nr:site-2 protease family protein [Bacillus manliponensis]KEK20475.1 membrane protein [Bacillus manliponensis]
MEKNKKGLWGVIAAIGILLFSKFKWVLAIFKLAKFSTVFSMFLSLGAYAMVYGWKFGVALVYLLLIHEMGHLWAAKRKGIPTSPAIFIPFMGALIGMKEMPKNAKDEAFMAYMGPLFGLLSFLPAIPLYMMTGEPFWALVILLGSMINFFNLIPVSPLDGGRIVSVVSTKIWALGLVILLGVAIVQQSMFLGFIFIIGCMEWYRVLKRDRPIEEIGWKIEVAKQYIAKMKEEFQETKAVHRTLHLMHYEMNAFQNKDLSREEQQKKEALEYILPRFMPFDFVPYEDEKEEYLLRMQDALEVSEKKIAEWEVEKDKHERYYNADMKTRIVVFIAYLALLAVLGFIAYEGYSILEQHLPR